MKAHINDQLATRLQQHKEPWESWSDLIGRLYREAGYEEPEAIEVEA